MAKEKKLKKKFKQEIRNLISMLNDNQIENTRDIVAKIHTMSSAFRHLNGRVERINMSIQNPVWQARLDSIQMCVDNGIMSQEDADAIKEEYINGEAIGLLMAEQEDTELRVAVRTAETALRQECVRILFNNGKESKLSEVEAYLTETIVAELQRLATLVEEKQISDASSESKVVKMDEWQSNLLADQDSGD